MDGVGSEQMKRRKRKRITSRNRRNTGEKGRSRRRRRRKRMRMFMKGNFGSIQRATGIVSYPNVDYWLQEKTAPDADTSASAFRKC